jgi:hypothetical protein
MMLDAPGWARLAARSPLLPRPYTRGAIREAALAGLQQAVLERGQRLLPGDHEQHPHG